MTNFSRWQFTVDDFARMGEIGIFSEDDRVELIDGEIFAMPKITPLHAGTVRYLTNFFSTRVNRRAIVSVHNPLRLTKHTEPLPDVVLLKYRNDFYASGHPWPSDTLLVIEVADISLQFDRDVKVPRYAQSGVPEVWLVDLEGECVAKYTMPEGGQYREARFLHRGDTLTVPAIEGVELTIDEIFG